MHATSLPLVCLPLCLPSPSVLSASSCQPTILSIESQASNFLGNTTTCSTNGHRQQHDCHGTKKLSETVSEEAMLWFALDPRGPSLQNQQTSQLPCARPSPPCSSSMSFSSSFPRHSMMESTARCWSGSTSCLTLCVNTSSTSNDAQPSIVTRRSAVSGTSRNASFVAICRRFHLPQGVGAMNSV